MSESLIPGARVYLPPRDVAKSELKELSTKRQIEIGAASIDYKWHWNKAGYRPYGNDCPFCKKTGKCNACDGSMEDRFGNDCRECDDGVCFHCNGDLTIIHEPQARFHDGEHPYRAFVGSVGSGKTTSADAEAIRFAVSYPGSTGIIAAPTYKQLNSSTAPHFFRLLHKDAIASHNKMDGELKLTNESTIWFRSTSEPENIEGIDAAWFSYDEASRGTKKSWDVLEERLRQPGYPHRGWASTTPRGRNWFWERFADPNRPKDYETLYKLYNCTIDENPYLDKSVITGLKASRHGVWARQQLYGEFVGFEGLVYPEFLPETHVVTDDDIPEDWEETLFSHDWGYKDPAVVLVGLKDWDGRIYIVDEFYQSRRTIEHVAKARDQFIHKWGDGRGFGDPSGRDHIEYLNNKGMTTESANNDIIFGLQAVSERLHVQDDGKPRIFVHERCVETIREFMVYRYPEERDGKPNKDKPVDMDNHAMDSLRYMVISIDGINGTWGVLDNNALQDVFRGRKIV